MSSQGLLERADAAVADFLGSWNTGTTILAGVLIIFLLWPILTGRDPDIHPFLLARQSQASPVRQEGESAVYRANEIPYGYPLRKGLSIKDPGAPRWTAGRDGDLRDIWRSAVKGPVDEQGNVAGPRGKFVTLRGRDEPTQQDFNEVTRAINAIGNQIQEHGGKTVAVSLSNSTELLASIFASAFYDFKLVLVPYGLPPDKLNKVLSLTAADTFVAEAGSIELTTVISAAPTIKHIIWVAQLANRYMDWNEVPAGVGGRVELSTWHEIIDERKDTATTNIPAGQQDLSSTSFISTFWPNQAGEYELFEYTQAQLVAGIGGLLSTVARDHKLSHKDIVLPAAPLTESYTLCWTLAALHSNATIALNSVAGNAIDITISATGSAPTVIIASSNSILKHSDRLLSAAPGGLSAKTNAYFQHRSLASGILPPKTPSLGSNIGLANLRLLLIGQRDSEKAKVPSSLLFALRVALGARIAYALTSGRVVGAVCQSNILDYRNKGSVANVGVPLTCVEVWLQGKNEAELTDDRPKGKIAVNGPAVAGKKVALDVLAQVETDHTFTLL